MTDLKSLSEEGIFTFIHDNGLPQYRARQLLHWIYEKNVASIHEITEFSKELREKLAGSATISHLKIVTSEQSRDGTTKYLFELDDGKRIESVLIPDNDRLTLCVSSQVGCALGCVFCLTGKAGFQRNLKPCEITDQVLSVNRRINPRRITNIVFMGMGEPLLNLKNVADAIKMITQHMKISKRRITVSTAGIAPKIQRIGKDMPMVNLAISLNAPSDEIRSRLMPINNQYNLKKLIKACRDFPLPPRRRITFEYVLIKGINDSLPDTDTIVKILRGIPSKINVIPLNTSPDIHFQKPEEHTITAFRDALSRKGMTAIIRKSKGSDISAACGQLRGNLANTRK